MRKILISLVLTAATMGLCAQGESEVLCTKKGIPIKPSAGDFAIGIDATPFFRYAGNLFSGNNPYFPSFGFTAQAPGSIFGKYKVSETTTYRAALLIGVSNETDKSQNVTDPDQVDKTTTSALTIGLTAGIEKHREIFGRMSGYYGAQAGICMDPYYNAANGYYGKLSYKDGNDSNNDYKETGGSTYCLSAGGFAGVEFYFAPRIALAGEFGYYLEVFTQGKRTGKPATGSEFTIDSGSMGVDFMPAASGNLVLLFYF
jgi:hypothetical protein